LSSPIATPQETVVFRKIMFNSLGESERKKTAKRLQEADRSEYVLEEIERRRKAQFLAHDLIAGHGPNQIEKSRLMKDVHKKRRNVQAAPESIAHAQKLSSSSEVLREKLSLRERAERRHTRKMSETTEAYIAEKCVMNGQSEYKDTISGNYIYAHTRGMQDSLDKFTSRDDAPSFNSMGSRNPAQINAIEYRSARPQSLEESATYGNGFSRFWKGQYEIMDIALVCLVQGFVKTDGLGNQTVRLIMVEMLPELGYLAPDGVSQRPYASLSFQNNERKRVDYRLVESIMNRVMYDCNTGRLVYVSEGLSPGVAIDMPLHKNAHLAVTMKKTNTAARTLFNQFDKDNSGFMDANELKGMMQGLGVHIDATEFEAALKEMDDNKSGMIGANEFVRWWNSQSSAEFQINWTEWQQLEKGQRENKSKREQAANAKWKLAKHTITSINRYGRFRSLKLSEKTIPVQYSPDKTPKTKKELPISRQWDFQERRTTERLISGDALHFTDYGHENYQVDQIECSRTRVKTPDGKSHFNLTTSENAKGLFDFEQTKPVHWEEQQPTFLATNTKGPSKKLQ
jgi:hypothetical protein